MKLQPKLVQIAKNALSAATKDENTIRLNCDAYDKIEAISIDKAIMEYISEMVMIKADFAWSDLGT